MSNDGAFAKRLAHITAKKAQEPSAPAPEPLQQPQIRSAFKPATPARASFLGALTPSRIIGLVGFAIIATMTLKTTSGIGGDTGTLSQVAAQNHLPERLQAACIEIHHPLDLIKHQNNPATATIPVCESGANN